MVVLLLLDMVLLLALRRLLALGLLLVLLLALRRLLDMVLLVQGVLLVLLLALRRLMVLLLALRRLMVLLLALGMLALVPITITHRVEHERFNLLFQDFLFCFFMTAERFQDLVTIGAELFPEPVT